MSKREFSKVSPALWRSERFNSLGNEAKILYLFYLTCSHQNSAGCYTLPDGYACSDLGWEQATYELHRSTLIEAQLVAFDPLTSELFILRWFQHCPPMNDKHALGTMRIVESIDSDILRELVEADFVIANEIRLSKGKPANVQPLHSEALLRTRLMTGGGRS